MHLALYRKYRPAVFDDVYGQEHITSVLKYQAANGRVSHAYLFCGSRGTGKTSSAKILAKAVNCLSPVNGDPCGKCEACISIDSGAAADVVEMDAASNNGVDSIRELCDEVTFSPAMLKRRVYIIDEVHMLSQSAFNALLKTLEEPPEHVLFILATTELHKLPATIISRCQRFDFRRIGVGDIVRRLMYIAEKENIRLDEAAAGRIAKAAQGGMRDAVSLFELCAGGGADVSEAVVEDALGISGYSAAADTARAVADGDIAGLFKIIAAVNENKDISVFWQELISFWRDMLVAKYAEDFRSYLDLTENEAKILASVSSGFSLGTLVYQSGIMDDAMRTMTRSPQNKRVTAELALVRMCEPAADSTPAAMLARISELEDRVRLLSAGADNSVLVRADVDSRPKEDIRDPKDQKALGEISETKSDAANPVNDGGFVPVPDMSGVTEKLAETCPMSVDFIKASRVEISADGGEVRIVPGGELAARMLSGGDVLRFVAEAFLLCGVCSGIPRVTVLPIQKKKRADDVSDELFD